MGAGTISVAMCTCNGAAYIAEQVCSILAQTTMPSEVLVCDDASEDSTVCIIEDIWRAQPAPVPRLKIIRNAIRLGVVRNFEQALAACAGDLIALSDQDDRWDPLRLATMARHFALDPQLLVLHSDATIIDAGGREKGYTLFEALAAKESELRAIELGRGWEPLLNRNLVTGATTVLRRELRDAALPVPAGWLHDEWLGMIAALLGGLGVERRCLTFYRQHGSNQVGAKRETMAELFARAFSSRADWHVNRWRRAAELTARAPALGPTVPQVALKAIKEKEAHHAARALLPAARVSRLAPVWREWRTGRYRRYGRGVQGVLRDLCQAP